MIVDQTTDLSYPQFLSNIGTDNIAYLITYQVSTVVAATAGGVLVEIDWDDGSGSPRSNQIVYGLSSGPSADPQDVFFIAVLAPGTDLALGCTLVGSADGTYRLALTYTQVL